MFTNKNPYDVIFCKTQNQSGLKNIQFNESSTKDKIRGIARPLLLGQVPHYKSAVPQYKF